jgi:hypothetical protein
MLQRKLRYGVKSDQLVVVGHDMPKFWRQLAICFAQGPLYQFSNTTSPSFMVQRDMTIRVLGDEAVLVERSSKRSGDLNAFCMESDGESLVMGAIWIDAVPEGNVERPVDAKRRIAFLVVDIERG